MSGKLVLHVMGAIAEFERGLIIERTNAGLEAARKRGQKFGRKVIVTEAKIAEAKRLMIEQGLGVPAAAKAVGISTASLYSFLPGGKSALLGEGMPDDDIAYPATSPK